MNPERTALELLLSSQSPSAPRKSCKRPTSSRKFFRTSLTQINLTDIFYIAFFMFYSVSSFFPQTYTEHFLDAQPYPLHLPCGALLCPPLSVWFFSDCFTCTGFLSKEIMCSYAGPASITFCTAPLPGVRGE